MQIAEGILTQCFMIVNKNLSSSSARLQAIETIASGANETQIIWLTKRLQTAWRFIDWSSYRDT